MPADWIRLYQPNDAEPAEPTRDPEPSAVRDHRARVAVLEGRAARGERLYHPDDWVGALDPAIIHEDVATPGEKHLANGHDAWSREISLVDRFPEESLDLPADWLAQELAAFRAGEFPLLEYAARPAHVPRVIDFPGNPRKLTA